jgi:hypothetical protein
MAKKKYNWGAILGITVSVIVILGAVIGCTLYITNRFGDVEKRLGKAEGAIKALASDRNDKTKDLIRELLAEAQERIANGQSEVAARAAKTASVLIATQKRDRAEASQQFFRSTSESFAAISDSDNLDVASAGYDGLSALAEYRAVSQSPVAPPAFSVRQPPTGEVTFIKVEPPYLLSRDLRVEKSVLKDGRQKLDGIFWKNVLFVNVDVEYDGGEYRLENVRFVNCRFNVKAMPRSRQVLLYAINAKAEFGG